jgi:hypothetical protein
MSLMVKKGSKPKYDISAKNIAIIEAMDKDFKIGRNVSVVSNSLLIKK